MSTRRPQILLVLTMLCLTSLASGCIRAPPPDAADTTPATSPSGPAESAPTPPGADTDEPAPTAEATSPWSMLGGGTGHTWSSRNGSFDGGTLRWEHALGAVRAAAASDGTHVFAGSWDVCTAVIGGTCEREDQTLLAVDIATGTILWEAVFASGATTSPILGDGAVFVPADTELLALEAATGEPRWTIHFGRTEVPAYAHGRLFLTGNGVYAYDTHDGGQLWRWRPSDGRDVGPALVLDDLVVVASPTQGLVALHQSTGSVAWTADAKSRAAPAIADGGDLLFAFDEPDGLAALDPATGTIQWRTTMPETHQGRLTVAAGRLLIEGDGGAILAHDTTTGIGLWRTDPDVVAGSRWVVGADLLVFDEARVDRIDLADGALVARYVLDVAPASHPILVGSSLAYGGPDGRLIAVAPAG